MLKYIFLLFIFSVSCEKWESYNQRCQSIKTECKMEKICYSVDPLPINDDDTKIIKPVQITKCIKIIYPIYNITDQWKIPDNYITYRDGFKCYYIPGNRPEKYCPYQYIPDDDDTVNMFMIFCLFLMGVFMYIRWC